MSAVAWWSLFSGVFGTSPLPRAIYRVCLSALALNDCRAGEWEEVEVPLERFLLTWRGKVIEQAVEMNPGRITGVGVSLAGGDELQPEGPYKLEIEWIAARNHAVVLGGE